jgi:hypothetical protein
VVSGFIFLIVVSLLTPKSQQKVDDMVDDLRYPVLLEPLQSVVVLKKLVELPNGVRAAQKP